MVKSAQQRFNEYLADCDQTQEALGAFEKAVHDRYNGHGYAYIGGYLRIQLQNVIGELPRKRREEIRAHFLKEAQKFEHENLLLKIKDAA
jgi:hypothetical protein